MKTYEDRLQQACVLWFDLHFRGLEKLLFAVPNGGKRHRKTAVNLKKTGTRSGVADLCFLWKGRTLFIEMKYGKGKQQETQVEWQKLVEAHNFEYIVCRSLEEFKQAIKQHINKEEK